MKIKVLAIVLILLVAGTGMVSYAVATQTNSPQPGGQGTSADAIKMGKITYFVYGGSPYTVALNTTFPGTTYNVGIGANVILTGKAYYGGAGRGYATFFNCTAYGSSDNAPCIASKLLPGGKWVTVTTPFAMKIDSEQTFEFDVIAPGGTDWKYTYFTLAP